MVFVAAFISSGCCFGSSVSQMKLSMAAPAKPATIETNCPVQTLIDSFDLQNQGILALADPMYSSAQGMCSIDNRYIVVARYRKDKSRDLMVYDLIEKRIKSSNIFAKTDPSGPDSGNNVDIGHVNDITYHNGFLYIPRGGDSKDIIRLKVDKDFSIHFDRVVYKASKDNPLPVNLACHNGVFYWTGSSIVNNNIQVFRTKDFKTIDLVFATDFGGLVADHAIGRQGMAFDGEHFFFAFSGRLDVPDSDQSATDAAKLRMNTEKVIITGTDGTIERVLGYPRGSYGEIEDVDTMIVNGNTYLLLNTNKDKNGVACVYAVPLYMDTVPSFFLEPPSRNSNSNSYYRTDVYCDNTACYKDGNYNPLYSNPFASGLAQDKFTSLEAALNFISRHEMMTSLHVSGRYDEISLRDLPNGFVIVLDNAYIGTLKLTECPNITLYGENAAHLGRLNIEKGSILLGPGISMYSSPENEEHAIEINHAILDGSVQEMIGYQQAVYAVNGIVNLSIATSDFWDYSELAGGEDSLLYVNGIPQMCSKNETETFKTVYLGRTNENTVIKNGKNIMLSLILGDGSFFSNATGSDYVGTLMEMYRPSVDVVVPAVIAEKENGDGMVGYCTLYIGKNGQIFAKGNVDQLQSARYILATATYLTE